MRLAAAPLPRFLVSLLFTLRLLVVAFLRVALPPFLVSLFLLLSNNSGLE
jgi:hypothetical protein